MNEEMRRHVERAVRPVRAGKVRKLQMREELLAHLTSLFEEERRDGDEATALVRAMARFGDPAEIARELDRSAGRGEKLAYYAERVGQWQERWIGRREGEAFLPHALRSALVIALYHAVAILLLLGLIAFGLPVRSDPTHHRTRVAGIVLGFSAAASWIFVLAIFDISRYVYAQAPRPGWLCVTLRTAAWSIPFVPLWVVLWGLATGDFQEALAHLPGACLGAIVMIPLGAFGAAFAGEVVRTQNQPYEEWARLRLED